MQISNSFNRVLLKLDKSKQEKNTPATSTKFETGNCIGLLSEYPRPYLNNLKMSRLNFTGSNLKEEDNIFVTNLEGQMSDFGRDYCRQLFLFSTAKLADKMDTKSIYDKYPDLSSMATFQRMKAMFDQNSGNERVKRVFSDSLGNYISEKLSTKEDELRNIQEKIMLDVSDLGLKDKNDNPIKEIKYNDIESYLVKEKSDEIRKKLDERVVKTYVDKLKDKSLEIFNIENGFMVEFGYPNQVDFYTNINNHNLRHLSEIAEGFLNKTKDTYTKEMGDYYKKRTGKDFSEATRSDVLYVVAGPDPQKKEINQLFPEEKLIPLAEKTFDGMGLGYSKIAKKVDYKTIEEYEKDINSYPETDPRIILDITKRSGKRARAYLAAAKVPSEIYLSVKPEGGLTDYSSFFHENGHANHYANMDPSMNYAERQLGNKAVKEAYAYLFEKLMMNKHWLQNMADLKPEQADQVVKQQALRDLYLLRRYSAKMIFETEAFDCNATNGIKTAGKGERYQKLLTDATGFKYNPEMWLADIDGGFYVADYFTAWTLEAQLKDFLERNYGTPSNKGENWYTNPKAGEFLKSLWKMGNPNPKEITKILHDQDKDHLSPLDPNDPTCLLEDIKERFDINSK